MNGQFSSLVVGFQETWEENFTTFIAMDYHQWGDLNRYVTTYGAFAEPDARLIAEQLVQAVFVLHHFSIVHRDIKPEVLHLRDRERSLMYVEHHHRITLPH